MSQKSKLKRSQEILANAKLKLEQEIVQLNLQLKEEKKKERKLKKYLKEKSTEIQGITKKIKDLASIEAKSKGQIDKNIELLRQLLDSIDDRVNELKEKMVQNSEKAIKENVFDLNNYVNDLEDIMAPLGESTLISNQALLSQTIIGIAMTLEMFSENIEDSIDSIADLIQKANAEAVNKSSIDFDAFILDVHKIFDTFNNILQKLKLVNSIKKYLDLEEIYIESNQILDNLEENQKKFANLYITKEIKEEELSNLEKFGITRDLVGLKARKAILKKRFDDIKLRYDDGHFKYNELKEKYEFIIQEKETIRDWFEALTDEVISQQNIATETYNIMFSTLDSIDSTITFMKADLQNSSEREINLIIQEFSKQAKTFGKMVGIIKKVEKNSNLSNMQKGIELIHNKSQKYIEKIRKVVNKLSKQVKNSNLKAINVSFGEFQEFIGNFKTKFSIIQDAVSVITLSGSGSLINDLLNLSDDQIKCRQDLLKYELDLITLNTKLDFTKKQIQGIENELKLISSKGKIDLKRRKVLKTRKYVSKGETLLSQLVQWEISNVGLVPFENFTVSDLIPKNQMESEVSLDHNIIETKNKGHFLEWNLNKLNKREKLKFNYTLNGFSKYHQDSNITPNNISSIKSFRYRNIAKPVSLTIIERDGQGAIILTNLGETNNIWNLSLQFEENSEIIDIPNISVKGLRPQQAFIKKYKYKKSGVLKPIIFSGQARYAISINQQRSTEKKGKYNCEVIFENKSEFLMHLVSVEVFEANNNLNSIFHDKSKNLDRLRPNTEYRKKFMYSSSFDPPRLLFEANFCLQLVYEYDRESRVEMLDLQETSELEIDLDKDQFIKKTQLTKKRVHVHPEIKKIDGEIKSIREKIKDLELQITILRGNLLKNQEQRLKIKEMLKKKKSPKKTTKKPVSKTKDTKKSVSKTKDTKKSVSKKKTTTITRKKTTRKKTTRKKTTRKKKKN